MIQRSTCDLPAADRLNQENEASAMQCAGLARLINWQGFTLQCCAWGWSVNIQHVLFCFFQVEQVYIPRTPHKTVRRVKLSPTIKDTYDIWYIIYDVWCLISDLWCMIFDKWDMIYVFDLLVSLSSCDHSCKRYTTVLNVFFWTGFLGMIFVW